MDLQNRIKRVRRAYGLVKELANTLDTSLHIQDCDADFYCHFHSSYPNELFNALSMALGVLHDWHDDLCINEDNRKAV